MRGRARMGIADALRRGMHLLRDLDVIVALAAREDDVVTATWRIARRVEGQGRSARAARTLPATDASRGADVIKAPPAASAIAPPQRRYATPEAPVPEGLPFNYE